MANLDNDNGPCLIVNPVDHTISTLPNPILVLAGQLVANCGSRIVAKFPYAADDAATLGPGDFLEFLDR